MRDRVAARKKEGSFDEIHSEKKAEGRKAEGDMKRRLAERKKKAEEMSMRTHSSEAEAPESSLQVSVAMHRSFFSFSFVTFFFLFTLCSFPFQSYRLLRVLSP